MMSLLHRNQQFSKGVSTSAADIVYHGLANQGTTDYLNSVLQVLFMTKDFREAVERCAPHNPECIDPQLRDVFDFLLKQTSSTYNIRKKLGIHSVWEQRDAAEYFEKILNLTSSDASQIFKGESRHKIKCSHCRKENNTDGRFWHLPLVLLDSHSDVYSVVDGIKEYFRTSHFSGENQMCCDHYETKSDATRTCVMKHHPEVLTLLLKRFDSSHMSYVKINQDVVIPSSLQIPENQTYELYAWVDHFGYLRGGHYTATIKSQDDERWYNFNDDKVTLLDNQPFQTGNTEESRSVHLLFYKKKKSAYSNELCQPANRGDVPDRKGCNKKRQDSWDSKEARKHEQDKMKMMKVEEEEGGKEAEAYASAEKRELFSVGTQLVKREDDQNCERGKQKPVWKTTQTGFIPNRSDPEHKHEKEARHRSCDYPQVCEEERRDKERIDEKEKRKNVPREAKHLGHVGLDNVDDDEGGKQGKGYAGQNSILHAFDQTLLPAADIVYHGLFNQGTTCYLNSVLQVLFMTKDFREAVERCAPHNPRCIDPQLRDVFDELLKRRSYTYKITNKLGIHSVYEQRDAAEYFEKILNLTSSDASQIFNGESTHKIKCSQCGKESNTDGRFWHLPLVLVDSHSDVYSVVDGIKEYFRTSHFSGENQMCCDHCETKSDATRTCVMKHHPEVLTLLLKRFDYSNMSYVKINQDVVIPSSLQIPENQTYELYAWVDHSGYHRGGHYTATIKSQDDERWYNFNDDKVTLLDHQPFQTGNTEKSRSVHLLFYKKKKSAYSNGLCQPANRGDVPDRKGCNKKRQDSWDSKEARKHEQDKMKMMKVEEEEGGKEAEAYASAEKRELFSVGTQLVKREDDQNCERGKQKPVWKTTQTGFIPNRSDPEHKHEKEARHRSCDYPQVCEEERRDKERIDEKEKRKNLPREAKHLGHVGLDNMDDDEGGKQGKGYAGQNSTLHAFDQTLLPAADIVYHGLFNQGATCYLNSVLQVLFMTKDFREAVERCAPHNPESIDPQLRDVFNELLKRPSYTYKITNKLGIHKVWEQRDAAEYFEKILNLTSSEASQIFNGESRHKITCSDCCEENNTDGRFWHLPLELVDSHSDVYSVVDGIDEYFGTSYFSRENQMYCDNCETKSDATMTCVMKHHPEVLTLLLKRFDFDYRNMSYVKNNRDVVVPSSIQIPENQTYELYAWVDHFGDLRGGHYTATIKSQDDERWYNFNDARVTLRFQTGNTEKSRSVHLLFYKKKKSAYSNGFCQPAKRGDVPDRKGYNKNRQDSWDSKEARKHEQDKMKMMKVEEEEGGKEAEAYASAEKRGRFSEGTELVKREDDQNCERGKQKPVWKTTQTGFIPNRSDPEHKHEKEARHRSCDYPQVCVAERRDKERIDEKEKRKNLPREAKHLGHVGLDNMDDDEGGKQGKGYAGQNSTLHAFDQTLLPAADIVYHGLFNQGATCYLNSVLQVLFMTKDFREAVERCAPHNPRCIDPQLRDVFDELLKRPSYTYKITNKLGIHSVWEQRDAAEYFEKILTLTSSDASQIFKGESRHKIKCSNCHEENNTDGRFWHLPLVLLDSHSDVYSVVDGIKEYFRTSHFSGENQMYCDHCETKSDATRTCVMKHHPEVLTLLLKRFDYRYMSYYKNNRVVVVPSSLQIPENQTYELYAWVDHFGDLRGGHYTATIKSQDDEKWYNFNDDKVTLLDHQPFQTGNTEESRSVHLLFYKKKKTAYSNGLCQPANRGDVPDRKGCIKKRQDSWDSKEARKHEQDKMKMMKVEEEEGGKEAEAYASVEKRELFSVGTQLVKREDDQNCERGKQKPVWKTTQTGFIPNRSDPEHKHEKEARHRSCVEEPRDKERIDEKEKRKNLPREAKHLGHVGLDNMDDDEGGKQGKGYAGQNSTLHAFDQTLLPAADIVYHGLFNQGATCYLNSVLQVLFMTKDFREAVERCAPHNPESIDPQLRDVFDELLKRPSYTYKITNKLGIHSVYEQDDAAEYFEKILTMTSSDASQIFKGESRHKIKCSHCRKENNTDGRFWHLPLVLLDSHSDVYSVVDGIKEYFRTSHFSGENQMCCDHCETKSDATRTCVMKHHPEVLTLLLKRFDYRYMSYYKNNRVVVVPSSLQIPENQTYELYAWVDHFGYLRGGHYTATIKSQDDEKWYNFNDASVTLLDHQPFQTGNTEESRSVHLLFYKKKKTAYSNGLCQPANRGDVPNRKGCNKKRQDSWDSKEARKHEQDKMKMMKVEEEEGGKEAEAYASAEKRELFSVGTQLVKREDDQNCERGKQKPVWKTTQTGFIPNRSDPEHKHEKEARHRSCVEEPRDKERIDEKEKRKNLPREAKHLGHVGLDNMDDDEGGKQGKGYAGQNSTLHAFDQTLLPAADIVYHGLFNQGATCYLNSVLQVLFMTKDFREAVERCAPHNPECIDPQLRDVFDDLLKRPSYTYNITKKLGIHSVWEQRDAAEYFEKILNLTSSDASQIFKGESRHKIKCSNCCEENNTDGRFWHLPLELVDSNSDVYSVVDGIKEYFRTSHFSRENQMYCDHCETKSDATMTCVMKHHPEVLTLLLKRFDFDYRYMSYVKNNRVVVVPSSLQIPENQTYELYAWVDHFGDLRGGHYTATIKSQDDERWYNFNDARVTLLDNQLFQTGNTEKSRSVHLLFYKKKKTAYSNGLCQPANRGDVPDRKGCNKNGQDSWDSKEARKHEQDKMKMMKVEEEEGGKEAEAYASAEKRGRFSVGTELVKREDDQNCEPGKQKPAWKTTQTGFIPNRSDPEYKHEKEARHRSPDYPQVCVEERRDKERNYQKEKRTNLPREARHLGHVGLDNMDDDEGGKQGKSYAGQNKRREDERREKDNKRPAGDRKRDTLVVKQHGGISLLHGVGFGEGSDDERRLGYGPEEKCFREKQNKGDAQCSQIRYGRRRQAVNQGDSGAGNEEWDWKSQRGSEVKNREKTPQDTSKNRERIERESDPRPNGRGTLTKGLSGINLNESPSPDPQRSTAGNIQEESETDAALQSRGEHAKKQRKKNTKWQRVDQLFHFFLPKKVQ